MHRPPDRSKNFTLRVGKRLNEKAIVLETRLDLVMKSYTKSRCNQAPVWYGGDEEQKRIPCYGRLTNKWNNRDYQIIERSVGMEQTASSGSVLFLPLSLISHQSLVLYCRRACAVHVHLGLGLDLDWTIFWLGLDCHWIHLGFTLVRSMFFSVIWLGLGLD